MEFPNTLQGLPGYDSVAVDALMVRVKKQHAGQVWGLITSGMLAETRFELVVGGYQIPVVDAALAQLADTLESREQIERLGRLGRAVLSAELVALQVQIKRVLDLGAIEAFDYAKNGYRKSAVLKLVKLASEFSKLADMDSFVLRSAALGRALNGLDRDQVDEFLTAVTGACARARALA